MTGSQWRLLLRGCIPPALAAALDLQKQLLLVLVAPVPIADDDATLLLWP
jgi:hypothetical protein